MLDSVDQVASARFRFRPLGRDDLPLTANWLALPHVREWWGDPAEQLCLVSGDLDEPAMEQYIVETGARPVGYLQCYRLTDWNTGFGAHPEGTRGIDLFVGDPELIGRGHGSALIRQFTDGLLSGGAPRVVTDPDPENARAIRAYEKAGFRKDKLVDTPDGPALLMVRTE